MRPPLILKVILIFIVHVFDIDTFIIHLKLVDVNTFFGKNENF